MVYETNCKLCDDPMSITVENSDDKASREMGFNPDSWMGKLICVRCGYYRDRGKRPPLSSNIREFLVGEDED